MYNCHTHIFTIRHVPDRFLPLILKWLADRLVTRATARFFSRISKGLGYRFNRYVVFKAIGEKGSQAKIFEHLDGFYPTDTSHVVLSMDMQYMGAGDCPDPFEQQLDDLAELKQKLGSRILPFVFAHPERPDIAAIVQERIENQQFSGIKIYPALGYFPCDPNLDEIFDWAAKNQVPIMTHCTRGGVYYKGRLTEKRRTDPADGTVYAKSKNSVFTDIYSDPDRYIALLDKYPRLKICFAHFGGANEWDKYMKDSWHDGANKSWYYKIKQLMIRYENVYTDVSYTLHHAKYYGLLKVSLQDDQLRNKILFGTDYYMQEQETSERAFGVNLRAYLGEDDFEQIATINPEKYLATLI